MLCGFVSSSLNTVSTIFAVSDLEKPRLRGKLSRSSSLRATIRSRATLCRCHWLVTSRHQQSQPLGIIAGSLYLHGAESAARPSFRFGG